MAKQALAANNHRLFIFGQSIDFHVVTSTIALAGGNFMAARNQKTQVVLHGTAGHGSGEDTITFWNTGGAGGGVTHSSANFVVERIFTPQAARAAGGGADLQDTGVDVVRVIDEDQTAFHAGNPNDHPNIGLNTSSIGIEISNLSEAMWFLNARDEPDGITGRHTPLATCPTPLNIGDTAHPNFVCPHPRPTDPNRWIHLAVPFEGTSDLQALDDEQYTALILLLRHLCIRHGIPRQFFGNSRDEIFKHWFYGRGYTRSQLELQRGVLTRFRGILAHRNVHASKICPGLVNRNLLFRGITDEWWLPVQPNGDLRLYYSGPFKKPPFVAAQPPRNYCFRYTNAGRIEGVFYRDADIDALLETRSYYDTDQAEAYYALVENWLGGSFPMGTNKVWHGGVHLAVQDRNPCVFAASSGTIVAARLSSNAETERHPQFGSQRFVLLKHAIFRELQWDAHGLGQNINYDVAPKLVFSLYMHLDPVADPAHEADQNPPWFNLWRRDNPAVDIGMDGDKGRVFVPNSQVCAGDILGTAGRFRGRRMIHFEIVSHRDTELQDAPWDDADQRAFDNDQDLICSVPTLEQFLAAKLGLRLEQINPLAAARELRKSKAFHKSEWGLTEEAQVTTLIPNAMRRQVLWPHIRRFSWVAEAVAANPRLANELGNATGMFWHYHPVTFMQHMNELALAQNREIKEGEFHQTNVQVSDDYFLTNFERFDAHSNTYMPTNVDRQAVRIADVSNGAYEYHFTRADIACMQAGAHAPESTPPQSTRFSLALLETLEQIRQHLGAAFGIALSHVCEAHANAALCVMNDATAIANHHAGTAVDIRPGNATAAAGKSLWNSMVAVVTQLNSKYAQYCGQPSQGDLPGGYDGLRYTTTAGAQAALTAVPQQNIPAAEVADFRIHLELITAASTAAPTRTVQLKITVVSATVLNEDLFDGDWEIQASINGAKLGSVKDDGGDKGKVIQMDWSTELTLPDNGRFNIVVSGVTDLVSHWYGSKSNPPWAAGKWSENSLKGAFRLTWKVEWINQSDFE